MYVQIICNRLFPIFLPQGPFIKPCLGGFSDSHEHMLKPIEIETGMLRCLVMCISGTALLQAFTLWLFNIAMENGPFIDDFPIEPSIYRGFSMAMLNNQMVSVQPPDGLNPYGLMVCLRWFSVESLS